MPSESEHRIEGLLRAWANKRREEAGKRFVLHPATRRLLLGEVVRRFPKREVAQVPLGLVLKRLWNRTVSVVGLFIILVAVGWAVKNFWTNLPRYGDMAKDDGEPPEQTRFSLRRKTEEGGERRLLASNQPSSPTSQPLGPAEIRGMAGLGTRGPASAPKEAAVARDVDSLDTALARRRSADSALQPSGGRALASPGQSTATNLFVFNRGATPTGDGFKPVISPALPTGGVVALTEGLGRSSSGSSLDRTVAAKPAEAPLLAQKVDQALVTNAPMPAAAPAAAALSVPAAPPVGALSSEPESTLVKRADSLPELAVHVAGQPRADQPSAVLRRFEVRQNGPQITLIDADGSVYAGTISETKSGLAATAPAGSTRGGGARSRGARPTVLAEVNKTPQAIDNLSVQPPALAFRAAGTNLTLNQSVVIEGTLSGLGSLGDRLTMAREMEETFEKSKAVAVAKPAPTAAPSTVAPSRAIYPVTKTGVASENVLPLGSEGATNAVLLQGTLRLGTNAGQAFRAKTRR